jgi:GNAT superfamily N-acetyltransferase
VKEPPTAAQSIVWSRLDGPGRDACSLRSTARGWLLDGVAEFSLGAQPVRIHYAVRAGSDFETLSASLRGTIGTNAARFEIERNAAGWWLNGGAVPGLEACVDLDLGFTPATNLLPIRRLALQNGERASASAAWLDVARGSLEMLPQWYERRAETAYWYEAPSVEYAALLEVDASGFALDYPGLWRAERRLVTREASEASDLELLLGLVESYAPGAEELRLSRLQLTREFAEAGKNRVFLIVFESGLLVAAVELVLKGADADPELADGVMIAHVHHLRVRQDMQRQGLGRESMRQVESEASERGFRWLTLGVDSWNASALRLYEALGYVRFKQAAGPGPADEVYYLRKNLSSAQVQALRIRRLEPGQTELLRELRLAALRDAPDQFGEALADAEARSVEAWTEEAASVLPPSVHKAYIAELSGTAIGMAYALTDRVDATIGRIGGMWVAPSARRLGVGAALVEAVIAWWRAEGKRCVQLWVVPGGAPERLYRRAGFAPTGVSRAFPESESRRVIQMQLDLVPGV